MPELDEDLVLDFVFEMGQLKRLPRTGWFRAGIEDPESVADHNLRAAQLAYLLAVMEDHPDPERVCAMLVFHEIGETRVTDLDHVAKLYTTRAEDAAAEAQLAEMGPLGEEIYELWDEVEHDLTEAGRIAKDADKLEAAITAKEYVECGYAEARAWIDDTRQMLETDSALRIIDALETKSFTDWWQRLDFEEIR